MLSDQGHTVYVENSELEARYSIPFALTISPIN